MVRKYLNRMNESEKELAYELVRAAVASVAKICVIPIQDYLLYDNSARINFPSSLGSNWRWRLVKEDITKELTKDIKALNSMYGRA